MACVHSGHCCYGSVVQKVPSALACDLSGIVAMGCVVQDRYTCAAGMGSHHKHVAMGSVVQTGTHVLHACTLIRHC